MQFIYERTDQGNAPVRDCGQADQLIPITKMDARPSGHCELRQTSYAWGLLLGSMIEERLLGSLARQLPPQMVPREALMYSRC